MFDKKFERRKVEVNNGRESKKKAENLHVNYQLEANVFA